MASYIKGQPRGLFWQRTDSGLRFIYTLPAFSSKKDAIALADLPIESLESYAAYRRRRPHPDSQRQR